jgi:hypothetical protein
MILPGALSAIVEALRSAGATEEITAAAVKAGGEFGDSPPSRGGRPRKYADSAPWLVRGIFAAREQRLASHRVEAAPPAGRTPAIEWDEFVGGYRAGLIEWNTARLGPKPGKPGSRAPAEMLREHGY